MSFFLFLTFSKKFVKKLCRNLFGNTKHITVPIVDTFQGIKIKLVTFENNHTFTYYPIKLPF